MCSSRAGETSAEEVGTFMRVKLFLAAITLSATIVPVSAWSQHGGGVSAGHSGMSSHMGGGQVGHAGTGQGFPAHAAPSRATLADPSRAGGPARPLNQYNGYGGNWTSSGFVPSHSAYNQPGHYQSGRNRDRHVGYGYGAIGYSFFPYGDGLFNNDFYGTDADDPNNQQPVNTQGDAYADNAPPPYIGSDDGAYAGYPPPYAQGNMQDSARAPYNPGSPQNARQSGSTSDGLGHPKVTLIFKDGRAPMEIQNYAMSQTKLFIRDNGTDRDIAISDLDVPATMAANDQSGVDFELPVQR
jgi:hypothetical protein